jgi:chemotaxis protein CheD
MFVDTGVPQLFLASYKLGAKKERLIVKVAGGASVNKTADEDHFQIGKRNFLMLRKLLWKNGVLIKAENVGGQHARTMSLVLADGEVIIRANGVEHKL